MNKQIKTAAIFLTVICAVVVGCHKVPQKQPADKTSSIASNEEYTSISLPHFLSWVTVAGMLRDILGMDGIVNMFLQKVFGMDPIFFLGNAGMFRQIVVISDLWKGFGFGMIVYLAAISNIDQSLYEAAQIDGAGRWKQTLYVTIPCILPMVIVMATLSLGNVLNAGFDQIFNLYSPLTYSTGDIIDTYVYRQSLVNGQYSFGTAVGLFKSGVSLFLTP